jgi:ParB family chromosome partitioning protein
MATTLTVEQIDPAELLVDANIRTVTALDKDFLASVRDLGVLVPVVAVRTSDGAIRVRYGHRRTLAAIEAKRESVPVIVTGGDDADEIARIVSQWHENEHRAGLSTGDKLAAVEQLALLGLSPAQIVKRTKARKADVTHALAAAGSELAKGAAGRWEFLTLDQAAAVAEFDSEPDIAKALIAAAKDGDGSFAHVLQRARDDREEAAQVAVLIEQLAAASVTVVDRPDHSNSDIKRLEELVTDKGKTITEAGHAKCPGHAAFIERGWRGVRPVYACIGFNEHGHQDRYAARGRAGTATPLPEEAREQRRQVLAHNRAWRSAETVRREWLSAFLTRKTAPKGASAYVAGELTRGGHELRKAFERGHALAATLLGLTEASGPRDALAGLADKATEPRAQLVSLALVLAAVEDSTGPHSWRSPSDTVHRYFTFLAANGYTLSEVEKLAAGKEKQPRRGRGGKQCAAGEATGSVEVTEPAIHTEHDAPSTEHGTKDAA